MDTEVLKSMILENLKDLRRFAYSLTNDISDADDLTQIVVERMLTKAVPDDVIPLAWMFKICKNAWIDEIRSRKVRSTDDNAEISQIAPLYDNHKKQEDKAKRALLKTAINELPDAYRIVMSLVITSGLSYAETSQTLDIPIGTVMSRVARAREKLATKLKKTDWE